MVKGMVVLRWCWGESLGGMWGWVGDFCCFFWILCFLVGFFLGWGRCLFVLFLHQRITEKNISSVPN